ncbi:hypothetical protein SAMN05443574_102139 [Haloarcula vallismortis]|uniref:Uncharacterized protein n=2 Tax=Haloarcula vallismortis TaxID=28442 RepID=M0JPJ6_HALVA|nr:hypothetical protein [Haloarcula vallismortis]EMA10926.1 hypothetical protein C437_02802 [Haloarcula vallismortis ATCC 29715]SDW25302.1 hypothetical protein SAMN05443574_102139 [Haloarcula vallismortis]
MSKASAPATLPEKGVRNRSQYADTLHRLDQDADEPQPACPEAEYRSDAEFTDVPIAAYRPHYKLCGNPECFGGDWR